MCQVTRSTRDTPILHGCFVKIFTRCGIERKKSGTQLRPAFFAIGLASPANPGYMARSRLMRSSIGGWVLNRLASFLPLKGLTMNMWAVD